DRAGWPADVLEEELAKRDEVLDEQVRLIFARAVAGGDPRMPLAHDVATDGWRCHGAWTRAALNAMRVHDQTAAPARRHLDVIRRAAEHPGAAHRRALGFGARRVQPPYIWAPERQPYSEQSNEPSELHPRLLGR